MGEKSPTPFWKVITINPNINNKKQKLWQDKV